MGTYNVEDAVTEYKRVLGKTLYLLGCLGLVINLIGCARQPSVNTNINVSANSANQTASSRPTSPAPAYASGGLGLELTAWEQEHGKGKPDNASSPMFYGYEDGKFQVQFSKIKSGNVEYIESVWGDRNAVPIEDARKESKQFIPADSKFVKSYTSRSGSTVDLYVSESLKGRFSDEDWTGGKPGDFIILYRNQTGKTTTFIISTGNNP